MFEQWLNMTAKGECSMLILPVLFSYAGGNSRLDKVMQD
ncbi:hypothetical protein S7335_4569 [Synechococcus sp. PCC 7335]|nr:hypothetical protein S7335_4569 [Synechococcus sp. PCC 7335]